MAQPDGSGRLDYEGRAVHFCDGKRSDFEIVVDADNSALKSYIIQGDVPVVAKVGSFEKWQLREKYIHGDRIPE